MHFSKSERKLHRNDYNPPCNVYQKDTSTLAKNNNILTGSLAGPTSLSLLTNKNTFGYSSRFGAASIYKNSNNPGPGAHEIEKTKDNSKERVANKIIKGKYFAPSGDPSIPYSYYGQNPDQEEEQYIRQIQMNTNIDESHKKLNKSSIGYTFAKNAPKYPTYIHMPTSVQEQMKKQAKIKENWQLQQNQQPQNYRQNEKIQPTSIIWQQKIKKSNQRRLQIIQMISPDYVPSLQLIQLIKKRKDKGMPGPTDYYPYGYDKEYAIVQKNKNSTNKIQQNQNQDEDEQNEENQENEEQKQYEYFDISGNKKGITIPHAKRFSQYEKNSWNKVGPGDYEVKEVGSLQKSMKNLGNPTYSFAKSDRKVFEEKGEGEFRFYLDSDYGSTLGKSILENQLYVKAPIRGGSLYHNNLQGQGRTHFNSSSQKKADKTPFGSCSVRFPTKVLESEPKLTLTQQKQLKNKQKLNKMIRTRMMIHKKLGTDKNEKDEGLLGISTIASTID